MAKAVKSVMIGIFLLSLGVSFAQESNSVDSTAGRVAPIEQEPLVGEEIIGEGVLYTLGKDDVVKIMVRNQPEFSGQFVVGPDGKIQYAFLGDIQAEGLTKDVLKEIITRKLERYIKTPDVSVIITSYRSKYVYILGEVNRPGKYPMRGNEITLRNALVAAGLPTRNAALRRVHVIKPDDLKPNFKKVDIYKLLYKGILEDNVVLTPGDLVVVPSTVPAEINRALGNLLSPITRAAVVDDLINRH